MSLGIGRKTYLPGSVPSVLEFKPAEKKKERKPPKPCHNQETCSKFETESESSDSQSLAEAVIRRYSLKKVFFKISRNSQENTCARVSFFNKVAGLRPATLLKKRLWHRCFPVNFAKFLRNLFSQNTSSGCFWPW